jgi:parvulin-like peptidyl-prolyl isomerase
VVYGVEHVTDEALTSYLRYSRKIADLAALAERDARILRACEILELTVSDDELQAAGDAFRVEHKLLGATQTLAWLNQQRISLEDWTQGLRIQLLTQKLKEHLFSEAIDGHYLANREGYRRVALSQILVTELTEAMEISQILRTGRATFCALALEHSKAQMSATQGGFVGVRFLSVLMPEVREAIANLREGEISDPIQTRLGYRIFRVEKRFEPHLSEALRAEILETLFQNWLGAGSDDSDSQ